MDGNGNRGRLILALARARGWKIAAGQQGDTPSAVLGARWEAASIGERDAFERELATVEGDPDRLRSMMCEDVDAASSLTQRSAFSELNEFPARGSAPAPALGGRYELRKEHARGGMGRILVVLDKEVGREVAMKELLPQLAKGFAWDRERFLREARITGQLEHPNIVPVYEIGGDGSEAAYYTMKLVRGETMEARLDRVKADERLTPRQKLAERLKLLDAFIDVCNAVAYAHSRGIVNRDLKPANVMLGDFGETVVLDWGLARILGQEELEPPRKSRAPRPPGQPASKGDTTRLTLDGDIMGTPEYMAPEQARGDIEIVDGKSDVYALGVMLFEIVTGRTPFFDKSAIEVLRAVIMSPVPEATVFEPAAPPELAAVAAAALAKDRAVRLESAKRLAEEVRAWRDGRPMSLYRHTALEQVRRFTRHNRALALALGGAALILVAGGGVSLNYGLLASQRAAAEHDARQDADRKADEARRATAKAEAAERVAQGQKMAAYSTNLVAENPTAALLVAMEAARRAPGSASTNALWGALAQLVEHKRFIGHEQNVVDAKFSPDGRRVATAGADFTARIWDVETGAEVKRLEGHRSGVGHVEWSADGAYLLTTPGHPSEESIAAFEPPGTLDVAPRVWDTATWECVRVLKGHRGALRGATWAPGHRVLSWGDDGSVRLWDLTGSSTVFAAPWNPRLALISNDGRRIAATLGPDVCLWSAEAPEARRLFQAHGAEVRGLSFSADSKTLLSCGTDGVVARRDAGTFAVVAELRPTQPDGKGGRVAARDAWRVMESPDGGRVLVHADSGLHVFSADLSTEISRVSPWDVKADRWTVDRDWTHILCWNFTTAMIRDVATGADVVLRGHEYNIESATFSPDGKRVVTAGRDSNVIVWNTGPGACLPSFRWSAGRERTWPSFDGTLAICRGADGRAELHDNATGALLGAWELPPGDYVDLGFLGSSHTFFARPMNGNSMIVGDEKRGFRFTADTGCDALTWWATSPGGGWVYIAAGGRTGRLWNVSTGIGYPAIPDIKHTYNFAAVPDDGRFVAGVQSSEARVVVFTPDGAESRVLKGHTGWTISAAFAKDGSVLTTAMDATVRKWDLATGAELASGRWPLVQETWIALSPAGDLFALYSGGTARYYRVDTLDEVASLPRSLGEPVGFTQDGKFTAARRDGGFLHLPMDALAFAEKVVPREFTPLEFKGMADTRAEGDSYGQEYSRRHPRASTSMARAERARGERKFDEALRQCEEAVRRAPFNPQARELTALAQAQRAASLAEGSPDRASAIEAGIKALEEAANRGYRNAAALETDPEFEPLRSHARWSALVAAAKKDVWDDEPGH